MLFGNKRNAVLIICYNIDTPWKYYAKWKMIVMKTTYYMTLDMKYSEWIDHRERK